MKNIKRNLNEKLNFYLTDTLFVQLIVGQKFKINFGDKNGYFTSLKKQNIKNNVRKKKMGLTTKVIAFQEKIIQQVGLQWENIRICELGAMCMRTVDVPAKKFYIEEKKVLEHISIDLNGMYGSLVINLCFPVPKELLNRFNLITDFGTIEHVNNQYQVFKNVHNMCSLNGIMIHTIPTLNYWKDHCLYFYSKEFFINLAKLCNYKILSLEMKSPYNPSLPKSELVFVALSKQNKNKFISRKKFNELEIMDFKNLNNSLNYYLEKILWKIWNLRHYIIVYGNRKTKEKLRIILSKIIKKRS